VQDGRGSGFEEIVFLMRAVMALAAEAPTARRWLTTLDNFRNWLISTTA
jgi:hypothetical protein